MGVERSAQFEGDGYLTLNDAQERNIDILCQVAKSNGASISLGELAELISLDAREQVLEDAWVRSTFLRGRYEIVNGRITEKESFVKKKNILERDERARWNLRFAKKFAILFSKDKDLKVLAVSGSTSYYSVSEHDDLDLFCVTRDDSLWIFLLKALIRSRQVKIRDKFAPALCFSYVIEESRARTLFSDEEDGLFARDAITAEVLKGKKFYGELLKQNEWIGSYFATTYHARISELLASEVDGCDISDKSSIARRVVNRLLKLTLGNYIRVKSYLLNRRFAKAGNVKRHFRVKLDTGVCLFESEDYVELRRRYAGYKRSENL